MSFAGYASSMTLAGDYLYVPAGSSGLRIYQLGPNGAMSLAGTYSTTSAQGVAVQGGIAYLADGASGVRVLGVSNPASPILHTTVATGAAATTVYCDGTDLIVGLAGGGIELWDVSVPLSPYKVTTYPTANEVEGLVVGGDYLILGEGLGGLEVVAAHQRRFKQDLNLTQSSVFAVVNQDAVQVRLTADSIETLGWEISANAGADWNPVSAGDWTAIDQPGAELKWRVTHTVRFPRDNPSCSDLQIEWLFDAPVVTSISDVPNDQGRQVGLSWTRSGHDLSGNPQQVVEYAVYRRIEAGAAGLAAVIPDMNYPPGDWHFVMTVPADAEESYAVVAPTLGDSTAAGLGSATFFVRARTAVPGVYFDATPASGYSVDNLAPSVPSGLKMSTPDVLSWDESLDADFRYFTVYRSQSPQIDGSTVQIGQTIATSLDLTNQAPGYFLVTASDFAGNESGPATLDGLSPVPDLKLPQRTALIGNVPNPFNPATVIHFDLSGPSPVRLKVFDVSGRVVRSVLAGATLPAGRHEARWDGRDDNGQAAAAGVYLYRLEAGSFRETRRMTLLK